MKKLFIALLVSFLSLQLHAQWAVADAPNLAQNVKNYVELQKQVDLLTDQKSKLDEGLDMMRKVNTTIGNSVTVKNIMERQIRLSSMCVEIVGKYELSSQTAQTLMASIAEILSNNNRMISLSKMILSSTVKMNDAERLNALTEIEKEMKEEEQKIYKLSSMNPQYKIDYAFEDIFDAYAYVKTSIVFDALFAIIAGIIITTLVFKLSGIVKDMISEGKGFNTKHFFEVGKEYMAVMLVIVMLPVFVTLFEQLLAYTADQLVNKLAPSGAYNHNDHIFHLAESMIEDSQNMDLADAVVSGPFKAISGILMSAIGAFFACAYNYVMHIFVANRYLMVLMMELVGPIAIVCLLNNDTRSSFFTWMKGMFGIFMLYPGFIMASVFADEYTAKLITNSVWPAFVLVIFSFILKLSLLATVKSMVNKWL